MIKVDLLKNHPEAIPALAHIWHEVLGKIRVPDVPVELVITRFADHLNDQALPITFIALDGNLPVGMCSLRKNDGIRPDLMPWLGSFVVDPKYQKQGIGRMLIDVIRLKAKELGDVKQFEYWHDFLDDKNRLVKLYGMQIFDPKISIVKYTTKRSWQSFETLTEIELKFANLTDLSKILKQSGLEILETHGDFMKARFDPLNSKDIILICKRTL